MAWSVLQSASSATSGVAFGSNLSSGSKIIAYVVLHDEPVTVITSVKDTAGNSLVLQPSYAGTPDDTLTVAVYAMDTPAGDVGGVTTITATVTGSPNSAILIQEVSGLETGTSGIMDGTPGYSSGQVTNPSGTLGPPSYASGTAGNFLVYVCGDNEYGDPVTWTLPSTYTPDPNNLNAQGTVKCNVLVGTKNSTGGTETGTWSYTMTANDAGAALILVAFKVIPVPVITTTSLPARRAGPGVQRHPGRLRRHRTGYTSRSPRVAARLGQPEQLDRRYFRHGHGRPGQHHIHRQVTDSASNTATQVLTLSVAANEAPVSAIPGIAEPGLFTPGQLVSAGATNAGAGLATGTGAALQAGGQHALLATGTGAALQPVPLVEPTAGLTTGTGTAQQPVSLVKPVAQLATGTGTAQQPAVTIDATAGLATGTGTAQQPVPLVEPVAQLATGTGTAQQPSVTTSGSTNASAGLATGTGTSQQPAVLIEPATVVATGTGTSQQPIPLVEPNAQLATGTGTSQQPSVLIEPNAQLATGTGTSQQPSVLIEPNAQLATGTGTAQQPAVLIEPNAQLATGTGTAQQPIPLVEPVAQLATGTGTAQQASVTASGNTNAPAQLATGTGTAQPPAILIEPNAGLATGTGTAQQPSVTIAPTAGLAAGIGVAQQPAVLIEPVTVVATAAGAALQASVTTTGGEVSPGLETYAFGSFPQIPPGSVISSVTVVIGEYESALTVGAPTFELHDSLGNLLGSGTGSVSVSPANIDQVTVTGINYAQLAAGLRVRIYASQGSSSAGATTMVDWVSLVIAFTPAGNAAVVPVTLNAAAGFPQCAAATGETAAPATLNASAVIPQCSAGLLNANVTPGDMLAAAAGFPQCTAVRHRQRRDSSRHPGCRRRLPAVLGRAAERLRAECHPQRGRRIPAVRRIRHGQRVDHPR